MKSANGKATGMDLISNYRLLQIASPVISTHLTEMTNYTSSLKFSNVSPVGMHQLESRASC